MTKPAKSRGAAARAASESGRSQGGRFSGGLPGGDLVSQGLKDLSQGLETMPALLVSIGAPRLLMLGVDVRSPIPSPETRLYELLSRENHAAAHGRYNSLVRRLTSFERALSCAR